jgi:SPP1 family predicted phage head-tail adaptor
MTLDAGLLNRRCIVQQPSTESDEVGQPIPGWTDVAKVWADIRMKSGLEAIKAGSPVSTLQASIRVRYRGGITAGMRVTHGGAIYNITAVLPDVARREFLDLICEVHS